MFKKCRHCGFENPVDVGDCLNCHRDLPMTVGEFREGMETLGKIVKGDWGGVAKKTADDFVGGQVSSLKYRLDFCGDWRDCGDRAFVQFFNEDF